MGVSEGCGLPGADDSDSYQWDDAHSTHQIAGNQRELLSQLGLVLIYEYTQTHNGSYHTQTDKAGQILISFTARFTLFLTLFLLFLRSCFSPPIHTETSHPPTYRPWGFGRAYPCCKLRTRPRCEPWPGPRSRSLASDPPERRRAFGSAPLSCSAKSGTEAETVWERLMVQSDPKQTVILSQSQTMRD